MTQLQYLLNKKQRRNLEKLLFKLGEVYCEKHNRNLTQHYYITKYCYNCKYLVYKNKEELA